MKRIPSLECCQSISFVSISGIFPFLIPVCFKKYDVILMKKQTNVHSLFISDLEDFPTFFADNIASVT